MKQRYINTKMWEDSWFDQLDPTEKLFFVYLLTSPMTNIVGAYEVSKGTIGRCTGLESRVVDEILQRFTAVGKAYYIDGWVVLPNFIKHQNYKSPKIKAGIEAELQNIPDKVQRYIKIPYAYGMHTVSHSNTNTNTNGIAEETFKTNFKQPKKKSKNLLAQAKDICQLFTDHNGGSYLNTIHIEAVVGLLELHGIDRVTEVALFALSLTPKQYQVQIRKPVDLADHWPKIVDLIEAPEKESKYGIRY